MFPRLANHGLRILYTSLPFLCNCSSSAAEYQQAETRARKKKSSCKVSFGLVRGIELHLHRNRLRCLYRAPSTRTTPLRVRAFRRFHPNAQTRACNPRPHPLTCRTTCCYTFKLLRLCAPRTSSTNPAAHPPTRQPAPNISGNMQKLMKVWPPSRKSPGCR